MTFVQTPSPPPPRKWFIPGEQGLKKEKKGQPSYCLSHSPGTGTYLAWPETGQEEAIGLSAGAKGQGPKWPGLQPHTPMSVFGFVIKKIKRQFLARTSCRTVFCQKYGQGCGQSPLRLVLPHRTSALLSRMRLRTLVRALKAAALYRCFSKREILQAFKAVASSTSTGPRPKTSRSSSLFWRWWCMPDPSTSLNAA